MERLRRHFTRYGEWWWVPVFYALAVAWIYRGLWHQHGAATGLGWDTIDSYGPDLDFFSRELREGRFSLWNPYDKGGYPLFCDPQIDRYYPFNWPFAAWGAMFGTGFWLVQIKVLAHHVVAASGMHLFLRTRGLGVRPSLIGGLAIVASAPMLVHKASIILWPLVWVPLVWVAIDAALAKPSWRRGVAVAAALTLPATAASPPGLWYALLAIAPYALWRLVGVRRTRDEWRRIAVCIGVAVVVLAPVLALAILPSRELVELGSRDRFATGRDFALSLSLPEDAALRGMFVRGAGLFETYMGAAVIVLAACALALRTRGDLSSSLDRRAVIAFAVTAAIGMVLAGGATLPILPWLVDHVPGFGLLRVPGRYKLVAAFPIAALAGYGAAALAAAREEAQLRVRAYATAGGALVIAIVLVAAWGLPETAKDRAAWWSIAVTAIACGLVVAVVRAPRAWAEAALGTLALCALFDAPALTFVEPGAPPASEPRQLHERDDALLAQMPGIRDKWRIYDEFVLGERAGARLGVRDFRGYPAIDPLSLHRYSDVLEFAKQDPAIITDFNVRYALVHRHFRDPGATYVRMPNPAFGSRGGGIWEAVHPAPLVVWYGAGTFVASAADVLPAMRALQEPDGDRRRVVLEPADAAHVPPDFATEGLEAREGQLVRYEPDEIRIMLDAPRPGLVVLNEIMFPGWRVSVDGDDATPLRANYLLRAVWVGAGPHTITWTFDPPHWRALVGGYVLALAAMLATLIRTSIQRRTARRAR